jgi:hypothetical protein
MNAQGGMLVNKTRSWLATLLVSLFLSALGTAPSWSQSPDSAGVRYAGVRSSIYGMRDHFPAPEGWGKALNTMAGYFPGSQPVAIWIVGSLARPGCRLEFPRDPADNSLHDKIEFHDSDRHEPYLTYFDQHGIKVFLQVEPGFAEVEPLIDLVLERYGRHPSVIGFGVDVEWYRGVTADSGVPVTDEVAVKWETRVKSHNPAHRLFLKHYDKSWLCQKHRGQIVFVDDSQQFPDLATAVTEFGAFAAHFYPNPVMFQIGYPADRKWWGELPVPPKDLGQRLAAVTRQECGIIWVDFTLRQVLPYE